MRPERHASATGIRLLTGIRRHPLSRERGVPQAAATTSERWSPESRNTLPVCAPVTSTAWTTALTNASSRSGASPTPAALSGYELDVIPLADTLPSIIHGVIFPV